MTKHVALAFIAATALACSADATDDTGSSEDAVVGRKQDFAYVEPAPKEEPLPEFDGPGPESKLGAKDVLQSAAQLNVKVGFDIPQPKY